MGAGEGGEGGPLQASASTRADRPVVAQIGAAQALDRPPQALAAALHQMNLAGYAAVEGPLKEAVLDRLGG